VEDRFRLTALLALVLSSPQALAADYFGKALAVSDGDTFTMESETGKVRVRICGIDAPERGQPATARPAGGTGQRHNQHSQRLQRPLETLAWSQPHLSACEVLPSEGKGQRFESPRARQLNQWVAQIFPETPKRQTHHKLTNRTGALACDRRASRHIVALN
jgi:hypothetical protein